MVRTQFGLPFCIDWLPDGRLLIVSGRENLLLRQEPDGSLMVHADLRELSVSAVAEIGPNVSVRQAAIRSDVECMLGGLDRETLFIVATEWRGMNRLPEVARARTGQVLTINAPARGAGWP